MNKMMKWTPGPWKIGGYSGQHEEAGAQIKGAGNKPVCHTSGANSMRPEDHWRDQANAHLISAAPELYDIVERYLGYHNGVAQCESAGERDECLCTVCVGAKEALAKARGENAPERPTPTKTMEELPDYGDLMTIADFRDCVESGLFTNDDGSGEYATATHRLGIAVNLSNLDMNQTHVLWFNK